MARDKNETNFKTRGSRVIPFYDPWCLVAGVVVSLSLARRCNVLGSTCADWVIWSSDWLRGKHHEFGDAVSQVLGVCPSLAADLHVQNFARWDFCLRILFHFSSVNQWERLAAKSSSGRCQFIFSSTPKSVLTSLAGGFPESCMCQFQQFHFHYCCCRLCVLLAAHM